MRDVPPQYLQLSRALRFLCLCPALWGIYIHLKQARSIDDRDARAHMMMKSSALDNYVGILWVSQVEANDSWENGNMQQRDSQLTAAANGPFFVVFTWGPLEFLADKQLDSTLVHPL